jgi:hypothetical protein
MARSSWPARLAGPRAGVLALLAITAAGCGTVVQNAAGPGSAAGTGSSSPPSAPSSSVPASHQLCARPAAVSRVVIARTGILREPFSGGSADTPTPARSSPVILPRPVVVKVVTSPPRAQALARALCALPRMPRGPVNCPAFFLGYYRLAFTAAGRSLPPVPVQVSGCRLVTGLGPVRQALRPAFWNLLARTGGWPATWPVHLPGGPVVPGSTLQPIDPGLPGCSPPTDRMPPSAARRNCPGPYRSIVVPGR